MVSQKEAQEIFQQYQSYQQQIQNILLQKENLKLQLLEIDTALDELEKTKEKEGYKIVGPIMVKKSVEEIKEELRDKRNSIDLRIKMLEKTETKISERLKDLESKLQQLLK